MRLFSKSRSALPGGYLQEIFAAPDGQPFGRLVRRMRPNIAPRTTLRFSDPTDGDVPFAARLTRSFARGERPIFPVPYEHRR